jgi:hypothetical protein
MFRRNADVEKREAVKAALLHSWEGYKKFAWGTDELMPQVNCRSKDNEMQKYILLHFHFCHLE